MIISKKNIITFSLIGLILVLGILIFFIKPLLLKNKQANLLEGWSYRNSDLCNIEVPLPPKEAPYIGQNGEYWNFKEDVSGEGNLFNSTAMALFKDPNAGSEGFVQGVIVISCAQNNNEDSTQSLIGKYEEYLNFQNKNVAPEDSITLKRLREENIWGQKVSVISFSGGVFDPNQEFYVVTTNKGIYLVSKIEHTDDQFVKQTVGSIFSNISFK